MKTSLTPQEIKFILCTASASLLLCSSMEVKAASADDQAQPWYRQDLTLSGFPAPVSGAPLAPFARNSLGLASGSPQAWDPVHGPVAQPIEVGYLGSRFAGGFNDRPAGPVLYTLESSGGQTQRIGLLGGQSQFQANSQGILGGFSDPRNDSFNVQGQSLGAFWSLTGAQGWHVDLSASGARVSGFSRTEQGQRQAAEGSAVTLSVQGGIPIGISDNWVVEPQAQLINQRLSLDNPNAGSGNSSAGNLNSWSGRVGARLQGSYEVAGRSLEPYLRTSLWHTVYSGDVLTLDKVDKISSSRKSSTVEVGLGLVARLTPTVSLYVSADYSSDVDDNDLNGLIGSLGVRMRW
ncbi:autotransporter outer membrane beta-barrel domain-containing protein [Pseudomonas chlororaphis]|uniref:Autotransporter outer membrane beta-barrel domain-containing protein n=1 Tax=Pseudomonas chlororaphis TaxID=587753 RepID=A0A1Q8EQM8_9PSED|nr:autotransporter outer membrane beta-barrel domain-containing protein [Pseudomonas chlororaphis]OLF54080.1 autotransporter outer membrane beta-barrel domain-containing protein [Pseudomonas chlororaphis]